MFQVFAKSNNCCVFFVIFSPKYFVYQLVFIIYSYQVIYDKIDLAKYVDFRFTRTCETNEIRRDKS